MLALMLLGSAGVVTALGSLVISFGGASGGERATRGLILAAGLLVLVLLSRSRIIDRGLTKLTLRFMRARGLDVRDYAGLLQISGGYTVGELRLEPQDWLAGRRLADSRLRDEGVVVLGIRRPGGEYVGVPHADTVVEPGDTLIAYGHRDRLHELDARARGPAGDEAHRRAVGEHARGRAGRAAA